MSFGVALVPALGPAGLGRGRGHGRLRVRRREQGLTERALRKGAGLARTKGAGRPMAPSSCLRIMAVQNSLLKGKGSTTSLLDGCEIHFASSEKPQNDSVPL